MALLADVLAVLVQLQVESFLLGSGQVVAWILAGHIPLFLAIVIILTQLMSLAARELAAAPTRIDAEILLAHPGVIVSSPGGDASATRSQPER